MFYDNKIWIGVSGEEKVSILPQMANRHGLIAGATGTGKTVTLKVLAESFSDAGVPVFLAGNKIGCSDQISRFDRLMSESQMRHGYAARFL